NERELAFNLEMKYRGLDGAVSESGNFGDIVAMLKSRPAIPTAVIFPQDNPALRFKNVLRKTKLKSMPLVTGFDDFALREKGLEHLTTLRVNRAGMGAAAVDILCESGNDFHPEIVRIPGTLIVRD
ncbi:MAG: substrate-binding domain-containing protein, partial [Victivallales bacterium]